MENVTDLATRVFLTIVLRVGFSTKISCSQNLLCRASSISFAVLRSGRFSHISAMQTVRVTSGSLVHFSRIHECAFISKTLRWPFYQTWAIPKTRNGVYWRRG